MFKYAQVFPNGYCHTISDFEEEQAGGGLVSILDTETVNVGDTYNNGVWTPAPPIVFEPPVDEIAQLKVDNESLNLQIIDLWETLIGAGVI